MLRWLILWPFTTSPAEEELIDRLNRWFGGVPGIKQVAVAIVLYMLSQSILPERWRWDPYPFVFLVLLITIVSLTSNQWLMNAGFRASHVTDEERRAILQLARNSVHMMESMKLVLARLERDVHALREEAVHADRDQTGDSHPVQPG